MPDPPKPDILRRTDGVGLFYRNEINQLYGDPEDGKTMIALAACADIETGGPAKDPGVMDFPGHTATKPTIEGADSAVLTPLAVGEGSSGEESTILATCSP